MRWCKAAAEPFRESISITQDFPKNVVDNGSGSESETSGSKRRKLLGGGIEALSFDYADQREYVEKSKSIIDFELEGECAVCHKALEHDEGIYTICPSLGCQSVTHLTCLSKHFLEGEKDALIPVHGTCPTCKSNLQWVDVVKEASLRMRGEKEILKLLKPKKLKKIKGVKGTSASQVVEEDAEDEDEAADLEMEEEMEFLNELDDAPKGSQIGDSWHACIDSESDTESITSTASEMRTTSHKTSKTGGLKTVIEDSDWDDAIEL